MDAQSGRGTDGHVEPRWLSEAELSAWLTFSAVMVKLPAALDGQLQRDAGLNYFEYVAMAMLSEAPGRTLRMSELAVLTNGSLSRLSHVIKRLENRGWVRREPHPDDGRFTNAILTPDGYAKVEASAPGHVRTVRDLVMDALTPDQVTNVHQISDRILRRMEPGSECLAPGARHPTPRVTP